MADIVLLKGGGPVTVKLEVFNGDQASSSCELWILDGGPDHYKREREVKKTAETEGSFYPAGDDAALDQRVIEWMWTATRAPGSTATQGSLRIHVEQQNQPVSGYPLDKTFAFDGTTPVTYSLSRHIRSA